MSQASTLAGGNLGNVILVSYSQEGKLKGVEISDGGAIVHLFVIQHLYTPFFP